MHRALWLCGLLAFLAGNAVLAAAPEYDRDVRPILSRRCFKCHGPDDQQRKAELRLDKREAATKPAESGNTAIVPGKPDDSELVVRIFSDDETEVMPPRNSNLTLTDAEKQTLKAWIAGGAEYKEHWAFVAPKQAPLPAVKQRDWPKNEIDRFVLAKLEATGVKPSPAADRYTLARRVSLDLIGLPPTPAEVDAFVRDTSPDAYLKFVNKLLDSPHYGERWARRWLDLARYADTNGYEKDRARSIWPYRDWVVRALNDDLPFDQFTIQQLAGDMLPGATADQRIATGFHRNTMLNEEGGIDPLEFRYYAVVDRVNTTATVWLGLTLGCAQCHTHKYDPIPHREYYRMLAFLNNADEPEFEVPQADVIRKRDELTKQIAQREADLPNRFPPPGEWQWTAVKPASAQSAEGATLEVLDDASVRARGKNPEGDTTTLTLDTDLAEIDGIRLEALTEPSLGNKGPGRTPHGNFVLGEIEVAAGAKEQGAPMPLKIARADADFAQESFPVANAFDGNPKTGWAIHGPGEWNVNRSATFYFDKPLQNPNGLRLVVKLDQHYGTQHTLGRLRLSVGRRSSDDARPIEVRRREHLDKQFAAWVKEEAARTVRWTTLHPASARSNLPLLTVQPDDAVLASGDQSKRDVYDLAFANKLPKITAIRIEALPDPSLPKNGPGRIYYEGPFGDFFLSEVNLHAGDKSLKLTDASQSFANGGNTAAAAIDGDPQTGWSINGGQGRPHEAVFRLAEPAVGASQLALQLIFERYYAAGLGRFRVSVTSAETPATARAMPSEIEKLLLLGESERTPAQREQLLRYYVSVAPELASERAEIENLRKQLPTQPTTLVFTERPTENPRSTFVHKRGEFLQPTERVEPDVLSALPAFPVNVPRNRLEFARWLVSRKNPLTARVTVNRAWAAIFGRGLVRTTEDFGFQGESPTHPELLDWLAVEFMNRGWSQKELHRMIVLSATYQQSSRVTPELLEKDPLNRLLSRGPRVRLDAELIRDAALRASGLMSEKIGGASVFPPQPANVTSEGTYGALAWNVSTGDDRYRRGLYTFAKRTAPYAMFITFDAPSGEACVPRREASNTPLQALTLMNDTVFVEAAQALGKRVATLPGDDAAKVTHIFRSCLTRPPSPDELHDLVEFSRRQRERFAKKELDPAVTAGPGEGDPVERAVWTTVARVVLNLDEMVAKG